MGRSETENLIQSSEENLIEIVHCINNLVTGKYLTIERPVLNVNEIIKLLVYPKKIFIINIPFIKYILKIVVYPFSILKYFGIDYGLTLNRIDKLFKDTSFDDYNFKDFDTRSYPKDSLKIQGQNCHKVMLKCINYYYNVLLYKR